MSFQSVAQDPYKFSEEFPEPFTIAEAEKRLIELKQDLNKIRQQLGDDQRQIKMNLSDEEYVKWRHKATHARNVKSIQQQKIMHWIDGVRAQRAIEALKTMDPGFLLAEVVDMFDVLRQRHRIPLSADQQNLMALAQHVVNNMEVK